jgi:hypothetical protein
LTLLFLFIAPQIIFPAFHLVYPQIHMPLLTLNAVYYTELCSSFWFPFTAIEISSPHVYHPECIPFVDSQSPHFIALPHGVREASSTP